MLVTLLFCCTVTAVRMAALVTSHTLPQEYQAKAVNDLSTCTTQGQSFLLDFAFLAVQLEQPKFFCKHLRKSLRQ